MLALFDKNGNYWIRFMPCTHIYFGENTNAIHVIIESTDECKEKYKVPNETGLILYPEEIEYLKNYLDVFLKQNKHGEK